MQRIEIPGQLDWDAELGYAACICVYSTCCVCVCVSEIGSCRLVSDSVYHRLVVMSVSLMFGLCWAAYWCMFNSRQQHMLTFALALVWSQFERWNIIMRREKNHSFHWMSQVDRSAVVDERCSRCYCTSQSLTNSRIIKALLPSACEWNLLDTGWSPGSWQVDSQVIPAGFFPRLRHLTRLPVSPIKTYIAHLSLPSPTHRYTSLKLWRKTSYFYIKQEVGS